MAQCESHADEIEACVAERQPFAEAADERIRKSPRFAEHSRAGIEANYFTAECERLARNKAGTGRDIEDAHARTQSRATQCIAAVAVSSTKSEDALDEVVVARGAIEQRVKEIASSAFVFEVAGEGFDRGPHGVVGELALRRRR